MPTLFYPRSESLCIDSETAVLHALQDHEFDQHYPEHVRVQSDCHWTPVEVCHTALQMLGIEPQTRVLDIGCGPGKFCAIGAANTQGHFTGVEQRGRLVMAAREMLKLHSIPRVEIIHGNITAVPFDNFDAFYLFNPFEENILPMLCIDREVEMASQLYDDYTLHVQTQLEQKPLGTRVVTYYGHCAEVPECYTCAETAYDGTLKLWVKTHACTAEDESADL